MTKKYKVGDTVYVKDTVVDIDTADNDMTYRGSRCGWLYKSNVVDELPTAEPVKPVLPKDVADELEDAKKSAYNFFGFLRECNNKTYPETCHFMFYDTVSSDTQIKILSDAWYNGYTVEKPKLYNLILGTRDDSPLQAAFVKITDWDDNTYLSLNAGSIPHDLAIPQYRFTQEEIDKYNKNFWIKNFDLNNYKVEVTADIQTKEVEE